MIASLTSVFVVVLIDDVLLNQLDVYGSTWMRMPRPGFLHAVCLWFVPLKGRQGQS